MQDSPSASDAPSRRSLFLSLADRVEREEPSVELDRKIESALRGLLARTAYPPRYTERRAHTVAALRALAHMED